MPRIKPIINKEDIAPQDYPLFDELAALRGRISGPSTIVLHSPGLAKPWNEISEYLHRDSIVQPEHAELAVSATAREKDCHYVWAAHVPTALKAGVKPESITAVRERTPLDGLPPAEADAVSYVRELLQTNRVEKGLFDRLLQAHGVQWLVELTGWIGRYAALAGVLNSFEVFPDRPDADPLPIDPSKTVTPKGGNVSLPAGPRVTPITSKEQVPPEAEAAFDAVAEGRGSVRGPFSIMMYSPTFCHRVLDVGTYLRFHSKLKPDLTELATIATAREKDCPYVYAAHAPAARKAGASEDAITAVRDRGSLASLPQSERDVIDYVRQLLRTNRVSQDLFDRLNKEYGTAWLVELTCLVGHYGVITAILNAFEVAPAAEAEQLPL